MNNLSQKPQSCQTDVRRSALDWWETLSSRTKKEITDRNLNILIKGIPRTWQRLTDREIEKLYCVQHFA